MVALYYLSSNIKRLDTVRIDCALCKPFCTSLFLSFSVEHLNKITTNNLTLLLRIGNTSEVSKELFAGINTNNVQAQALIIFHYITELVLTQHTMINKDTGKVLAYSLIKQYGSNTRVDTARKTKDNLIIA